MARPADWAPLAEGDPVPGDPEGIRREAEHMRKVAEKLRTQAKAMRAIAGCDGLKGKYKEKLGDKARGLGRRLDLAEDRYRKVKGHLNGWADDMEDAQKRADRALADAKDAQRIIDNPTPAPAGKGSKNNSGKDDQPADDPAVKRAHEDLEAARRKLNSAVTFYGERADHYAGKIRSSIDDDMEDSWWNDVKAWVGDADWLDTAAKWLSNATTLLTFAAIFFPALGVVAGILTGLVFGIHLLMAATGNGSWS
ncbi:putative T7SS-secreted protein [Streptomyces sp. NPDC052023]|uniref:putative T7SS-secreted protein n=1 Tax=Streptomyces sp. NPDC052023 TaxID=3365681 RepID=UPI0037D76ED1